MPGGSACPGPFLEAKKGIGKVKVGEILKVLSGDAGTRSDNPAWAAKVGHEYLGVTLEEVRNSQERRKGMEEKKEKVVYIATHAGEDPERASLPFVLGVAALAMDVEATVALQGTGVYLAKKGVMENVFAAGLPPLKKLIEDFIELGGRLWVCSPCIKERQIQESDLIESVEIMAAAGLTEALLESSASLVY